MGKYKIDTLPSGSKRIRITFMKDGKQRSRSVTAKTEKEVLKKALILEEELKHHENSEDLTVRTAIQRYIDLRRETSSPATIAKYEQISNLYFSELNNKKINTLTDISIQQWVNGLVRKNLSPKTIRNVYGLLLPALKLYTTYTPQIMLPQKEEYIAKVPDEQEVQQIIKASKGSTVELPIILAAYGGLRMSEIRGLRWEDISEIGILIHTAKITHTGGDILKGTKSTAGKRILPLFEPIQEVLERTPKVGEFLVNVSADALRRQYDRILKELGLPKYRFHDLRHHAASVGAKLGIPDQYMMQYIGHSTVQMLRHYQHQMESAKSQYAEVLNQYYSNQNSIEHATKHATNGEKHDSVNE